MGYFDCQQMFDASHSTKLNTVPSKLLILLDDYHKFRCMLSSENLVLDQENYDP